MSQEPKEVTEINDIRSESVLSNRSTQTNSSDSSRSTLIREILTSDKSKELVDEIDRKISLLIEHINLKKYSERRKKYYTKKIINRIIESKYPESIINTTNFAQYTLPTSTPYDVKDPKTSKTEQKFENIVETPRVYNPEHLCDSTKETKTLIKKIEENVSEVKETLGSKCVVDAGNNQEKNGDEGQVVETIVVKKGEKSVIKKSTSKNGDNQETSKKDDKSLVENVKSQKKEEGSLTHTHKRRFSVQKSNEKTSFDNIKDLTPRTLCKIYKLEFNESSSSTSNTRSSSAINEDQIDIPVTRSKDWKYYKTTSEDIFEKKRKMVNRQTCPPEETAVEYAKKEKQRQITWINDEIHWLMKLKQLLEKSNASESISSDSPASTQYKIPARLVDYDSTMSTGSRTLKEINSCLEELQKILKEKKRSMYVPYTKTQSPITDVNFKQPSNSSSNSAQSQLKTDTNREKSSSSSKSSKEYGDIIGVVKNLSKPTEFEIKYFKENVSSSGNSCNDTDKENIPNNIYRQLNQMQFPIKCDSEVQTSFRSSNSSQRALLNGKKSYDVALQTSFSNSDDQRVVKKKSVCSTSTNTRSIAYFLTFEEMRNGSENDRLKRVTSNLEKVKIKVPRIPKDNHKNEVDENELELQEYLLKNRSDFIKSAEWRRQCINELMYMRDKRNNDLNQRILFTTKEMKNMTDKKYFRTEEMQNKLKKKKNEVQKAFNRQLASLFSKKLQQKTLKGQVTISTSRTIVYS